MSDYTSSEIQAAVEKVVRSSIRRPYGTLGNRDVQTTFNDLQDAASGVYILKPNAPFYTVFLGAQRLLGLLANEQQVLTDLIEAIENTNRRVTEIDNLAPLNNARAALDALSNAAGARSNIFRSIEDVPAFQRYDLNVQRFLNESSKNSRARGSIVPTPQESRASLPGLVRSLQAQHEEVLFRSLKLADSIDDYDALNLPSLVASSVIARARAILEARITELEALSPKERLSRIRDTTLDLLAGRAAVQGLGSLRATTIFALIEGAGAPFADADHPATPASLPAISGPYPVWATANSLDFTVDSSFAFSTILPGSYLAQIDSSIPEPYFVLAGDNDNLVVSVETAAFPLGVQTSVSLTAGTRTAAQIAAEINLALPIGSPIIAESVIQTFRFIGVADLDVTGSPSDADFILPAPGTWEALGARQNDIVRVTDPLSPNFGCEFTVDSSGVNGDTLTCSQTSGPAPINEFLAEIEVGVGKTLRVRIRDGFELTSLLDRTTVIFPNLEVNSALAGNPFAPTPVPQSLGFSLGAKTRCRATTAAQIAQDAVRVATTQSGGVPRLDAQTEFVASVWDGPGRTDPDNPNKLIALRLWARGDVPTGQLGLVLQVSGAVDADVQVGDILVIRETPISADQDVMGTVLSFTDETITVDMAQPITGGSDLQIEVGPNLSLSSEYLEARVTGSLFQDGDYFMEARGAGDIPFEFIMEGQVPQHRGVGGQPQFLNLALGYNRVLFQSTKSDLTTKVEVTGGSAAAQLFASVPAEAVGSTPYFSLPEDPHTLQVGDLLEIYETTYNVVSDQFELVGLELSNLLIELSPEISTDFGTIQLSQATEPPFARIRLSKKHNFSLFEENLRAWIALTQNQTGWFVELGRLLNNLIVNENPTAGAVNSAKLHVQQLLAVLTRAGAITTNEDPDETLESILMGYVVEPVEEVNVLVDTYLERGATRGIDLLLQGQFNEFFGLSPEAMSYDGAAREALREVQRLDLPVRKSGRTQNLDISQTVAEWEDPDFEFDQSDTIGADEVEIPGAFEEVTPPGR